METSTTATNVNISEALAFEMEEVEKNGWSDMYRAAPAGYAEDMKIFAEQKNGITLITAALPIGLFNKTFMHGLMSALDDAGIKEIINFFAAHNAPAYQIYTTPFSKPAHIEALLVANGLEMVGATDKVYCELDKAILPRDNPADFTVELVDLNNAAAWADFICKIYGGLPNQPWLLATVNRKGWHHALARKDGEIIACRSIYIDDNKRGWLGIDAPIPGVMTSFFEADYYLCKRLLEIAQNNGVYLVNSCIEAIDASRQTEAYNYYYKLGFKVAYLRKLYGVKH